MSPVCKPAKGFRNGAKCYWPMAHGDCARYCKGIGDAAVRHVLVTRKMAKRGSTKFLESVSGGKVFVVIALCMRLESFF